jgi:hypothetical protein
MSARPKNDERTNRIMLRIFVMFCTAVVTPPSTHGGRGSMPSPMTEGTFPFYIYTIRLCHCGIKSDPRFCIVNVLPNKTSIKYQF